MMLSNAQVFVLVSSILGSALGEFISPASGVDRYQRQHRTLEIPWKLDDDRPFATVQWRYKKLASLDSLSLIYELDDKGAIVSFADNPSHRQFADRIEFKGDIAKKDFTLAIRNFVKDDEGVFSCSVRGAALFEREVTVKAMVLSNVTEFKTIGNNSEIVDGDNITLLCTTTMGQPSPRIEIRKPNGDLLINETASSTGQTRTQYDFDQISKGERGTYSCQVTTEKFTSKKSLRLDIKYPPEIDSTQPNELLGCRGKLINIDCDATGDPEPDVILVGPDGKTLPRKNGFVLKEYGTYRCEASSRLGNDSRNITVREAKDKPEEPSFSEKCSFTRLRWKASTDQSVKFTLQVKEEGSNGPWGDIITSIDTSYSPVTNNSLSKNKDYEFRVVATNCVGSTENTPCTVKGESSPEKRSSNGNNAGVIAGSVIAVLVVILIIVIAAVYCRRKRKRESPTVRLSKKSPPSGFSDAKPKPGGLLYSDSPNVETARVRPPVEYRQDEEEDDGYEDENGATVSQNVPSWV